MIGAQPSSDPNSEIHEILFPQLRRQHRDFSLNPVKAKAYFFNNQQRISHLCFHHVSGIVELNGFKKDNSKIITSYSQYLFPSINQTHCSAFHGALLNCQMLPVSAEEFVFLQRMSQMTEILKSWK